MKTLGRNADNDLYLEAGGLAILHDADAQCAVIESILQTQKGELQFDEDGGIDYFGTVLQNPNNIQFWAAQVTSKIEALDFVAAVEDFQYRFDAATSTLYWSMTVVNKDNERLDLRQKKTVLDGRPGIAVDWKDVYDKPMGAAEALAMVESMANEARDLEELQASSPLVKVKDVINRIVYDQDDDQYAASRLIKFDFVGVPLGTVIDFSNLRLDIENTGSTEERYVPFTVEISDGTKRECLTNMDGSALRAENNDVWFVDEDAQPDSNGNYPPTQRHTIMSSGNISITIRGNITGIKSADTTKPIFLKGDGTPFPYLSAFAIGNRVPLSTLGKSTFKGYRNLQNITWNEPDRASYNVTIGDSAFEGCESLMGLTWIPSRLKNLGSACFKDCKSITSLKGLEKVTLGGNSVDGPCIPESCFEGCTSLQNLAYLPEQRLYLGDAAFAGCIALKSLDELSDKVWRLGIKCFSGCTGLETILYLPDDLQTIYHNCFQECTSLRSLFVKANLTLDDEAFVGCSSLTNVMCEAGPDSCIIGEDPNPLPDNEGLAIYVPEESYNDYVSDMGWGKYRDKIFAYGSVDFRLDNVTAGTSLLANTSTIISDSIWTVEYKGTGDKPKRFESTTTSFPAYTYVDQPTDGLYEGTSHVVVKGYIRRMSAVSSEACPMIAVTGNTNPHLAEVSISLKTSLEMIGNYAFAQCPNLASVSAVRSELPFCLGERAFWGCSSLASMGWLNDFPNLGTLVSETKTVYALDGEGNIQYDGAGQPITHEEYTYHPAFGEGCFYESGLTAISYPTAHVDSLPPYCFAKTNIGSLSGIESSVLTSLGEHCFEGCESLTTISAISDTGVDVIPDYCFAGCISLPNLDGIGNIVEMKEHAFDGCSSLNTISQLSQASEISELPAYCFANCTGISTLEGIERIVKLGEYGFSGCTGITKLDRIEYASRMIEGETVYLDTIPAHCFDGCSGIKTLVGCYNVVTIAEGAFANCTSLRSPSGLGPSIASIGSLAFQNCTGLQFFSCVASSAPSLDSTAFSGVSVSSLPLYVRDGTETLFSGSSNWAKFGNITSRTIRIHYENIGGLEEGDINIDENAVAYSNVTTAIKDGEGTIPGVWFIDYGDGSNIVKRSELEDNPTKMVAHTYNERGAYDITLFGDIVEFKGSDVLYSAVTHSDPETVSVASFLDPIRQNATSILIKSPYLPRIGDFCFSNYGQAAGEMSVSISMAGSGTIGAYAFAKKSATMNNGIIGTVAACNATTIEPFAFYRSNLDSSSAFTSVQNTKKCAFACNADLPDLLGFSTLEMIGEETFYGCTSLANTTGLTNVVSIGARAFENCTGLETIKDFSDKLTSIGSGAFNGCNSIETIFLAINTPPALPADGFSDTVFDDAVLYVPVGRESTYETTNYWSKFASRITSRSIIFHLTGVSNGKKIADQMATVTATGAWTISYGTQQTITYQAGEDIPLPSYTFQGGESGTYEIDIKISGAVTRIGSSESAYPIFGSAKNKNEWLTSVESSSAMEIETFGDYLFAGCTVLTAVNNVPSVTSVGKAAFKGATALADVSGMSNVTDIGESAFDGCSSLEGLYGLSSVENIGKEAFNGCSSLKRIDGLGVNVASIGDNAFRNCPNISEVQMFAANPPAITDTTFSGLDLATVPLYVRTKAILEYQDDTLWSRFANIRSRYIEFTLTACPSNLTIAGEVGKVESDTFWMVDWDAYESDGQNSKSGESYLLPEHTYSLSGNHTFRIEGAVTGISSDGEYSFDGREPERENVISGESFISLILDGSNVAPENHYLSKVASSEYAVLNKVGKAAFLHNANLKAANLAGITKIGESAFAFSGIEDLGLLEDVSAIGNYAFYGCFNLHSVHNLGGDAITIGNYAFARLGGLKYIQISVSEPENAQFEYEEQVGGGAITSFGYFNSVADMKEVVVYVSLDAEYEYAKTRFQDGSLNPWSNFTIASQTIEFTLENVPSGTTIIGLSGQDTIGTARISSTSLWTVDWDDGTRDTMTKDETGFPEHTYAYSDELSADQKSLWQRVTIGGTSTWVRSKITIAISGSITALSCQSVANSPFLATTRGAGNPYLTKVVASEYMQDLEVLGDFVFQGCSSLSKVAGFVNVKSIGQYAFQGCASLVDLGTASIVSSQSGTAEITIDGVSKIIDTNYATLEGNGFLSATSIGNSAFANCGSLQTLAAFPSVLTIGVRAFANCIALQGITGLGLRYRDVSAEQFEYVDGLSAVFGSYAFEGCEFGAIDIENYQKPPSIQNTTFSGDPSDVLVFVSPKEGVEDSYRTAPVWVKYFENIIASSSITFVLYPGEIGNPELDSEGNVLGGTAIYGGNGLLAFSGNYVFIDWGDGTTTQTTEKNSDGWTFPNHFYTKSLNGAPVTIRIRGPVTRMYTADAGDANITNASNTYKPFLALSTFSTSGNANSGIVTSIGDDREYGFKITKLAIGTGSQVSRIGSCCFQGANIGTIEIGKPVSAGIAIGNFAFRNCDRLEDVKCSDDGNIVQIGQHAFRECVSLRDIDFVAGCAIVGNYAFYGCIRLANTAGLTAVTSIGAYAFAACTGLAAISLPATTLSVGTYAFQGCTGIVTGIFWSQADETTEYYDSASGTLKKVLDDPSVNIGVGAFEGCSSSVGAAWSVVIPSQVRRINQRAFRNCGMSSFRWANDERGGYSLNGGSDASNGIFANCENLVEITGFPTAITTIPPYTFYSCTRLRNTKFLPYRLQTIGASAFEGAGLDDGIALAWDDEGEGAETGSLSTISYKAFYNTNARTARIACTVASIGNYAFAENANLVSVAVSRLENDAAPEGVTIGNYAFFKCRRLENANPLFSIASGTIGAYAFALCEKLGNVVLPAKVNQLGEGCFNCSDWLTEYDTLAQAQAAGVELSDVVTDLTVANGPLSITWAFDGSASSSYETESPYDYELEEGPNNVTEKIVIQFSPLNLGMPNGSYLSSLTIKTRSTPTTYLGGGYTGEFQAIVYSADAVTTATGLDSEDDIIARSNTVALSSLNTNYTFEFRQFFGLLQRNKDYCVAFVQPDGLEFKVIGLRIFTGSSGDGFYFNYNSHLWTPYYKIAYGVGGRALIGKGCCMNCTRLVARKAVWPITEIPDYAFYNCIGLSSLAFLAELTRVGKYSFCKTGTTGLPGFSSDFFGFGQGAFKGCMSLVSIDGLPAVDSLPNETFSGCSSLSELGEFPSSIESLGEECFKGCSALSDNSLDVLGPGVHSIGVSCFEGCGGLISFHGLPYVYTYPLKCFFDCRNLQAVECLSSPAAQDKFISGLTPAETGNMYQVVEIAFNPRAFGIQYGWYITAISILTRTTESTKWGTGWYRVAIYDGESLLCVSEATNVTQINTEYTFNFPEGQRYAAYSNSSYTMRFVASDSLTQVNIGIASDNTAAAQPPYRVLGYDSPWYRPIITVAYGTDNAPLLGAYAFGADEEANEASNIGTIDLSMYGQKVSLINEFADPFAGISLNEAGKKEATLLVKASLVSDYETDSYWSRFATIRGIEEPSDSSTSNATDEPDNGASEGTIEGTD